MIHILDYLAEGELSFLGLKVMAGVRAHPPLHASSSIDLLQVENFAEITAYYARTAEPTTTRSCRHGDAFGAGPRHSRGVRLAAAVCLVSHLPAAIE